MIPERGRTFYQLREIDHLTVLLENALSDDETTGEWKPLLPAFLLNGLEDLLETLRVVVIVPAHG
jgi:hypothetical protein